MKELRTFTGKAQSIASLLYVWRPFVHMLYGAITTCALWSAPPSGPQTRWVRQIRQPLDWILAFLTGKVGDLKRRISLEAYLRRGPGLGMGRGTTSRTGVNEDLGSSRGAALTQQVVR